MDEQEQSVKQMPTAFTGKHFGHLRWPSDTRIATCRSGRRSSLSDARSTAKTLLATDVLTFRVGIFRSGLQN